MKRGRPRTCDCGECAKCKGREYSRAYRERNPGKKPNLSDEAKERRLARRKRRYEANKPQARAHDKVAKAIRKGTLARGKCEVGTDCKGPIEAHHDDYSKPLDVRWVCLKHHFQVEEKAA